MKEKNIYKMWKKIKRKVKKVIALLKKNKA
jgi:hypothetical protein